MTVSDITTSVTQSPTIAALAGALAKAQGEMKNPSKDSVNPHFKSKYADLATVRDAVLPVLSKNKLSVAQIPTEATIGDTTGPALVTMLLHESGEFLQTITFLRAQKNDPQGIGSALTYWRRYTLQSVAGVAAEGDDDGNFASRGNGQNGAKQAAQQPPGGQHSPPTESPYHKTSLRLDGIADEAVLIALEAEIVADKLNYRPDELVQLRTRCQKLHDKFKAAAKPAQSTTTNDDIAA